MIEKLKYPKGPNPGILKTGDHGRLRARRTLNPRNAELETVIPSSVAERRAAAARAGKELPELHDEDLHMYKLLQEQYNYTTIDHGSNCKLILDLVEGRSRRADLSQLSALAPTGFMSAQD